MDFKQIEAFVNVVKYKSFSKAADALFLTQPTISAHINSLEKELNMQLLNRRTKILTVTKEGMIFYKYAADMMNTRELAIASLKEYGTSIEGILEIQSSSIPGQYMIPKLIGEFSHFYPKAKYFLQQSDSKQVVENIMQGQGEIGFVGSNEHKGPKYVFLAKDVPVIITPRTSHFMSLDRDVELEAFIDEPFIQRERGSATLKSFEEIVEKAVPGGRLNVIANMNSMEAVKQGVAAGLGISVVSKMVVSEDEYDKYVVFEPKNISSCREFYMVINDKIALSPVAAAFKDFVINRYRKEK